MSGSALRWAAWNLRFAGQPGSRRALFPRDDSSGARILALESIPGLLGPGWEETARDELQRARRFGAGVLTIEDDGYPELLRLSSDPPPLLYVWGDLRPQDMLAIAVVGSRRATPHGVRVAHRVAQGAAGAGFTVVSGLARGIDAASHRGALEGGGRTLAVLGSGLDRIYPVEHLRLAEAIAGRGAVLSEFPFGTGPLPRHFPERNRVIAWLSWATVVVEAADGSGSLITAGLAAEEGRLVHAVPGPAGAPEAAGTNALLREGALVCRGWEDVLEDLAPQVVEAARAFAPAGAAVSGAPDGPARPRGDLCASLSPEARRVLDLIPAVRGIGIERLGEGSRLAPGPLLAILLDLELRGLVRQLPGRRFVSRT